MEDSKAVNKDQSETKVIEEVNRKNDKASKVGSGARGNSVSLIKSMSNTHTFDSGAHLKEDAGAQIAKIY